MLEKLKKMHKNMCNSKKNNIWRFILFVVVLTNGERERRRNISYLLLFSFFSFLFLISICFLSFFKNWLKQLLFIL